MPNASIVFVGIGASFPNPAVFTQLNFAQGPVSGTGAARGCLLVGNKTTVGTATPDTVVYSAASPTPCASESDVISLFGSGSQLHRMFLMFMKGSGASTSTPLSFLAVTESAGVAATASLVIATTATANGNHRFWCVDQFVDTLISVGDTATVIGGNIANSINAQSRWPVTAVNASGTVTITAKQKGPEGNWIRLQALISSNATIGTTTTLTANAFMTGGTTADVNTTALTTIASARYYYIVSGDSDATNIGRIVTQVNSQALPLTGIRQRLIFGSSDTLANTITLATGVNAPRAECVWGSATDYTPAELAAGMAGVITTLEQGSPVGVARKNFSLFPTSPTDRATWPFVGGRNGVGGAPTTAQITSALNNGISPITVVPADGSAQFVKRCTTYSLNGSTPDYRTRDAHKVSVCDYWCDDVQAMTQNQYGGKDLLAAIVQGGPSTPPNAVTPPMWGNSIKSITKAYDNAGQWSYPPGSTPLPTQSPGDVLNSLMIGPQIEVNSPNRMTVEQPLSPCAICDQFGVLSLQVG